MAKVAHEGNPKYDNIRIVEGDILSEAELEVSQGGSPSGPSAPDPSPEVQGSHAIKYIFSTDPAFQIGLDGTTEQSDNSAEVSPETFRPATGEVIERSRFDAIDMSGFIMAPVVRANLKAVDLDLKANGDPEPFRLYEALTYSEWLKLPFNTEIRKDTTPPADFTFIRALFRATVVSVTGAPRSGLAIAVDPASTLENFTGYVGAYDWATDDYILMKYEHQDIALPGTILASENRVTGYGLDPLTTDDSMSISLQYIIASDTFTVSFGLGLNQTLIAQANLPYFGTDMRGALTDHHVSTIANDIDSVTWSEVSSVINYS